MNIKRFMTPKGSAVAITLILSSYGLFTACALYDDDNFLSAVTIYENNFPNCDNSNDRRANNVIHISPSEGANLPGYGPLTCDAASPNARLNSVRDLDVDKGDWSLFKVKEGDYVGLLQKISKASPSLAAEKDGNWYVSKPGCSAGGQPVCGKVFRGELLEHGQVKHSNVAFKLDSFCPKNHWKNKAKELLNVPGGNPCNKGSDHYDILNTDAKRYGISGGNQGNWAVKVKLTGSNQYSAFEFGARI